VVNIHTNIANALHAYVIDDGSYSSRMASTMPEKSIKRRLQESDPQLADDDGPIFSTVAKLVNALDRDPAQPRP
jgi:hypothetical protein